MLISAAARQCQALPQALRRIGAATASRRSAAAVSSALGASADRQCHALHPPSQLPRPYSTTLPTPASTAQLVKQLREATGAPMMECKKALSSPEVGNDIDKAKEWLRKHGSAKASSKVAGREALEGLVGIRIAKDGSVASVVKVASETDFASRSETFSTFVQTVADAAAAGDAADIDDVPGFLASTTNAEGKLLSESLNDAILAIRENLQVDSVALLQSTSPDSVLAGYVHGRASPDVTCGTAAALVEVAATSDKGRQNAAEAAKKLAMHVVAAKPQYLDPAAVPEDIVAKEKEIVLEKMKGSNKPPEILEKIITGQLRKFYEGICLTEQAHMVSEGSPKVSMALQGMGLEVKAFRLMGMCK